MTLGVARLGGDPRPSVRLGQPPLADQPRHPNLGVGTDDDRHVLVDPQALLDEQRHVVDVDPIDRDTPPQLCDPVRDGRTRDRLQRPQGLGIREDDCRQAGSVEGAVSLDHVGTEAFSDCRQGRHTWFDDLARHPVGVGHNCPPLAQEGRDSGLARADPPGEPHAQHGVSLSRAARADEDEHSNQGGHGT